MAKEPVTQAVRILRAAHVAFDGHVYDYVENGGTAHFASLMDVDEYLVIKTLIMEDENSKPMIVLMHGNHKVSTHVLARILGVKHIAPCRPEVADRHSGYHVGGTSPFGTRHAMPVFCQKTIAELPRIFINGGKRGYIVSLATADAIRVLNPQLVDIATP